MTQTLVSPRLPGDLRRQTIATLLGAASFEGIDWRALLRDGVLVHLHVRRCRFMAGLTLEDIGLRAPDASVREKLATWLVLGEKRLLPLASMKALARIESGARAALKEHSFRTELGAFVPSSSYVSWRETTETLKGQYFALRDEILSNHRGLMRQVLSEYEVIAADTYERLRGTHPELVRESREQFVGQYCNRIAAQIPTPERIRATFAFNYLLVDGLAQLGTSQGESLANNTPGETAQEGRHWQRQVLEQDLRAHAQERVDSALDSFLASVVCQLRSLTYDVSCDVLATLERRSGESFAPQSVRQLSNLLAQVRALNFYGDTEIEQIMSRLQEIVEQSPAERQGSLPEIARTLRAIATITRATLLDLDEEPREARALSIPTLPTEISVRAARAELRLDLDEVQLAGLAQAHSDPRAGRAEFANLTAHTLWNQSDARTPRAV